MPKFVGYVLEEGGAIVGAIYAHEKIWWNNSEVFVEEMFVKPGLQRKGYGTVLLKQVEDYVKDKGLAGITLSTNKYAPEWMCNLRKKLEEKRKHLELL